MPKQDNSDYKLYAFPFAPNGNPVSWGLTKRELFAAMAMQGLVASEAWSDHMNHLDIARWAVSNADALVETLEKTS